MGQGPGVFGTVPLLFFIIVGIAFAIGNYLLAQRLRANPVLWAVLSLIPFVNYFFFIYVAYRVIFAVLDRLNALAPASEPQSL